MPRRSLLSAGQRARLFDVPTTPAEMATYYVLSPEDLLLVRAKRRITNRLGFAVQLCLLRHPGQGLDPGQKPPLAMLEFVAGQLGISTTAFADYARRDQTRREHAAELHALLGLRTHLRTGNPPGDLQALYAALLADGTNLGLSRMADATRGLSYHHLVNVAQWHVNEDNYASGRAAIHCRGTPPPPYVRHLGRRHRLLL